MNEPSKPRPTQSSSPIQFLANRKTNCDLASEAQGGRHSQKRCRGCPWGWGYGWGYWNDPFSTDRQWLRPGSHNLEIRAPSGPSYTQQIYVMTGKTLHVRPAFG